MLPLAGGILGAATNRALAQSSLDLADPLTPLGKAQAAALKASKKEGPTESFQAYRAVEAAKKFSKVSISNIYEAGLQALDPRNFSGPLWAELTGMKLNVVELSHPDQYSKPIAEHVSG